VKVVADECCANCGIAPVDDIQLKECYGGCDLVKYCSDNCQENHREQHKVECKKRKAELRDKELFTQPEETCFGECPLCFLPLPIDLQKSSFYSCCCQTVCNGCVYANFKSRGNSDCPFCREPAISGEEKHNKRTMKRVKANDPVALNQMGARHLVEGDYESGLRFLNSAAELGDSIAHNLLGHSYYNGEGVEKDLEKGIHHLEEAAIGGHPDARYDLACYEDKNGNIERMVKHLIIAAKLGYEDSMKSLWKIYSAGHITKEELEATLRTHKAAIDATKSSQREKAEVYFQQLASSR
jgi:hypothetical protein